MNKIAIPVLLVVGLLGSCGDSKETPESVAERWCELDKAVNQATSEAEEESARKAREAYEDEMEEKYGEDEAFMDKVEAAAEACENEGY
jgi:hypothetical protein